MPRAFSHWKEEVEKGLQGKAFETWREEVLEELGELSVIMDEYAQEHEPEQMRYQMRQMAGYMGRMPMMYAGARYYRSKAQADFLRGAIQKNMSPNVLRDMAKTASLEEQRMEDILEGMSKNLIEVCGLVRTDISYAKKTFEDTGAH